MIKGQFIIGSSTAYLLCSAFISSISLSSGSSPPSCLKRLLAIFKSCFSSSTFSLALAMAWGVGMSIIWAIFSSSESLSRGSLSVAVKSARQSKWAYLLATSLGRSPELSLMFTVKKYHSWMNSYYIKYLPSAPWSISNCKQSKWPFPAAVHYTKMQLLNFQGDTWPKIIHSCTLFTKNKSICKPIIMASTATVQRAGQIRRCLNQKECN